MTATSDPWASASYEGAEQRLRESVAAASPQQRLEWLEEALVLALTSGALERSRQARQLACEQQWRDGTGSPD